MPHTVLVSTTIVSKMKLYLDIWLNERNWKTVTISESSLVHPYNHTPRIVSRTKQFHISSTPNDIITNPPFFSPSSKRRANAETHLNYQLRETRTLGCDLVVGLNPSTCDETTLELQLQTLRINEKTPEMLMTTAPSWYNCDEKRTQTHPRATHTILFRGFDF